MSGWKDESFLGGQLPSDVKQEAMREAVAQEDRMTNKTVKELVERLLRNHTDMTAFCPTPVYRNPDGLEAANTLTQQAAEIEALREALQPFARGPDGTSLAKLYAHLNREHYHKARAALTGGGPTDEK